jgi:hypothetical protein
MDGQARNAIEAVLIRYATAIDRRDWDLFATCFADDVEAHYGNFGSWSSRSTLIAHMARGHERFGATLHRLGNIVIEGDDHLARTTAYVDALLMPLRSDGKIRRAFGRYEDELSHATGTWLIHRHVFVPVLICDMII